MNRHKAHYERHKEAINERRREIYDSDARKRRYYAQQDVILRKRREDRVVCALCRLDYNRQYFKTHLAGRHRLDPSDVQRVLCLSCGVR